MAIQIKGAPVPGWYLPVGEGAMGMVPYLWTGVAKAAGRKIEGFAVSITKHPHGPQPVPHWLPTRKIIGLGDPARYRLVPTPPDSWRDQDIRAAVTRAEEIADRHRSASAG